MNLNKYTPAYFFPTSFLERNHLFALLEPATPLASVKASLPGKAKETEEIWKRQASTASKDC